MEEKLTWPKKGDNPFSVKSSEFNSYTWASLRWLSTFGIDNSYLASAFKEAADKIVNDINMGNDLKHPDKFFMPVAYLYRHSLELIIKQIINMGINLDLLEFDEKVKSLLQEHKLHQLWNYARKVIETHWPGSPKEDLNAVESIIQEIHKVDIVGQTFRYTKDLCGKSNLEKLPPSVDLKNFKEVLEAVFNFFQGCEAGLDHAIDIKNEMLSEIY